MAITKPTLKPISSSIISFPYQYGHGWQRERKYASKRGYWLLISVHTSLELESKPQKKKRPEKAFKRSLKEMLLDILETEDSYIDVDTIIVKMKK